MKRYLFLAWLIFFLGGSSAFAQNDVFGNLRRELRNQGRQILDQQFQNPPRQDQIQPKYGSRSVPSEGGNQSGGDQRGFNPGDGGFLLPGNGGQPYPGGQTYPGGQPYPGGQTYPGGQPYPGGQTYPGERIISGGSVSSGQDYPGSPVMSRDYVTIRCPQEVEGILNYTLRSNRGSYGFTMSAGQEQRFRIGSGWLISYNDGAEQRLYKLEGGKIYKLVRKSDDRWQLYAAKQ